jgi:ActR/RegA family two-component response regulator
MPVAYTLHPPGLVYMQGSVLVVEPDSEQALALRDALLEDGRAVQVADTFQAGVKTLAAGGVGVLVTAVRLAAFNGLHLIARTRALYPHVRCIVIGLASDRSRDIDRLGVPFFEKPVDGDTIVAAVSHEIDQAAAQPQRRWPRKPVHLAAVVSDADLEIIDLSYGGLRLQGGRTPVRVGTELTVRVPSLGVSVTAVARWTKPLIEDGVSWCGAEILDPSSGTMNDWRGVVDSLS